MEYVMLAVENGITNKPLIFCLQNIYINVIVARKKYILKHGGVSNEKDNFNFNLTYSYHDIACGCSHKTYTDNSRTAFYGKFVIIHEDTGLSGNVALMYDKDTKIVYFYLGSGRIDGISPYYIIINGESTIAIYGINYEYQE